MSQKKIGIPRALNYYLFPNEWENVFTSLGCKIIYSKPTNKDMAENGIKHSTNDVCLPVKAFHGHVLSIIDESDIIFLPRYISFCKNEYACPYFCGIPEMIRHNLNSYSKIIDIKVDMEKRSCISDNDIKILSESIDKEFFTVKKTIYNFFSNPLENKKDEKIPEKSFVVLLGHPYILDDPYLNMNISKKLSKFGIDTIIPNDLSFSTIRESIPEYSGKRFYNSGIENIGAAMSLINNPYNRGYIYITPFSCGVDSIITDSLERRIKKSSDIPFIKITIDEHTGESGFDTRLEAFVDVMEA